MNSTIQYHAPYPFSLNAPMFVAKESVAVLTVHFKNGTSSSLQNKIGSVHANELYFSDWTLLDDGSITQLDVEAYGTVTGKLKKKLIFFFFFTHFFFF